MQQIIYHKMPKKLTCIYREIQNGNSECSIEMNNILNKYGINIK